MAIQVSSIAELQRVMMQQVSQGIQKTEGYLVDETKNTIDEVVYKKYTPKKYKRTYTLRDSVQITQRHNGMNNCGVTVGHNDTASWFSIGDGVTYNTPSIVTNGTYGVFIGMADDQFGNYIYHNTTPNKIYGRPRRYMDATVNKLEQGNKYLQHLANTIGNNVTVR